MKYRTGIDLGGTKTEVLVLDADGAEIFRRRVDTPSRAYERILSTIDGLVRQAETEVGAETSVGIGIPGSISPRSGLVRNANTTCLIGKPLREDLQNRLGREVRVENDANCFALSEALGGAARGRAVVFGVIIGTGTGGGLVVDGRLVNGPHSISGEWGHNPLPWPRPEDGATDCYCGKRGCIETYLSGPGLARNFLDRYGRDCNSREIVAGAAAGERECREMMASYHDLLARSLAHLINILDPDAIVLGGGMSNIDSIYVELPRLLPGYVFSDFFETPILRAERGDSSGVFGAAMLW